MQAIEVHNLGKKYVLLTPVETPPNSMQSDFRVSTLKKKIIKQEFWALRGISFSLPKSRMLGIIGDNGSGKSTLLKLLAGITYPSEGELKTYGKVAAMLELGVGFHPELSGMENIFLTGSVLGMSHKEITSSLSRIIDFSGLGDFIYTPVKHYSSGMFARLGFSIAIHSEPDILLVDEILAVGDAEFQMRCLEEIKRLRAQGTTVVLISHNISLVEMLSDEVFWLDKGRVRATGNPSEVCHLYRQTIARREEKLQQGAHPYFQAVKEQHIHHT